MAKNREQAVDEVVTASEDRDPPEDLRRFHRRTWELELLISAAVVFALLKVPSYLDSTFASFTIHTSRGQMQLITYGYLYLTILTYILIVSFFLNLVGRAYWVGLIGLQSVFPQGIRWDRARHGPLGIKVYKRQPSAAALTAGADRFCSLTFSAGSLMVVTLLFSLVMIFVFSGISYLVSWLFLGGEHWEVVLFTLFVVFGLSQAIPMSIDKRMAKRYGEEWQHRKSAKLVERALVFLRFYLTPGHISNSIYLTLFTNVSRKLTYPVTAIAFVGLFGFLFLKVILPSDRPWIQDYRFYSGEAGSGQVRFAHYESLRPAGEIFRTTPSIQSDIVSDSFVKLFIPYSPRRHNEALTERCSGVEPFSINPLTPRRQRQRVSVPAVAAALGCLAGFYTVDLNGERLDLTFDFYAHPETAVRGIVTYIPADDLPRGRNLLRIERLEPEDEGADESDGGLDREYFIPFWV